MTSVIDLIVTDHATVKSLYQQYSNADDGALRERVLNSLIREISIHSTAEEIVVYPLLESRVPDGREMVIRNKRFHQNIKDSLYQVDQGVHVQENLLRVMTDFIAHGDDEEQNELPLLRQNATPEELVSAGERFSSAKMMAPTRPHPSAPTGPILESIAGVLTKPIDALRDTTKSFHE